MMRYFSAVSGSWDTAGVGVEYSEVLSGGNLPLPPRYIYIYSLSLSVCVYIYAVGSITWPS